MLYSIYQIHKLGLLLNARGEPYRHRSTLTRILAKEKPAKESNGPHGPTKYYSKGQLADINKRARKT